MFIALLDDLGQGEEHMFSLGGLDPSQAYQTVPL
jgi:hypothetical protein